MESIYNSENGKWQAECLLACLPARLILTKKFSMWIYWKLCCCFWPIKPRNFANVQPLKFTSAVGNCQGFCWGKQCFYRIHLGKNIAEVITYFTTKLLFTNKRYLLHVLEKCLYVLQEVRSIIYVRQFIHPLSLHSCGSGTSFTFTSYIII